MRAEAYSGPVDFLSTEAAANLHVSCGALLRSVHSGSPGANRLDSSSVFWRPIIRRPAHGQALRKASKVGRR